jgi:multicomponent Na+:H+ antiporter subunit D
MSWSAMVPLGIVLSSLIPGLFIFVLGEERVILRTTLNMVGAGLKLILVGVMIWGVLHEQFYDVHLPLLPGLDLVLRTDNLSVLFVTLSSGLWLVTTVYAIGYLEDSPHRSRFFGFFSLCVSATVGIALAGDLFTFLFFYEMLTLSTYPLVVHRGTTQARQAGRAYLTYTVFGGTLLLVGTIWLYTLTGNLAFTPGGIVADLGTTHDRALTAIFVLLIAGVGVKAALVPLHGWLPQAMVAPAPVSALLHAVAVVKAGAFGIVRIVYDTYGIFAAEGLGLTQPLLFLAALTIVYGSVRALYQDDLKRRLAFSTVSQVSYIALGTVIVGPVASIGAFVHLIHQGIMKITLFFCAGNLAETLGIHKVSEMDGVGRRMPWTMAAFTIGAFGMIGVPPVAGFVSKWYLGTGALAVDQDWVIGVLIASSVLNAGYFLPILYRAWFARQSAPWPRERDLGRGRAETAWALLLPPLVTAALALLIGLLAAAPWSPLGYARIITREEYGL